MRSFEVASPARITAFIKGRGKADGDEKDRKRLEKVTEVLKEWRRRRCYGMTEVLPRLYVGNMGDAADIEQLLANKITDVLSVHSLSRATVALETLNVLHLRISDLPEVNIADHFHEANSFIHAARISNRSVLVHCLAGASRSVCIVAAYILTVTNMSYASTLAYLASKRPCANPNFGFRMQLIKYAEKKMSAERTRLQTTYGTKCFKQQQMEDEEALCKSGLFATSVPSRAQSEKILLDLPKGMGSSVCDAVSDLSVDDGLNGLQHRDMSTKSASSDCLLSSPWDSKPCEASTSWRPSELTFIDQ
ncbi:unnamed protein product [Toxocara canis]|uniref:Dual specificity protein phosphatase 22 n=1 Tax=Toxocara canis TaxID=6265 RepID=A0A3P7GLC2_TOXCA|nr:unnamed protein product [Toxocara canis]